MDVRTDNDTPDPRSMLQLAADQTQHTAHELHPRTDLMYLAWGLAWLLGFGAFALAAQSDPVITDTAAGVCLGALCIAAAVVTVWTVRRAADGVGGTSSRVGLLYGLAWLVGFACMGAIMAGFSKGDFSADSQDLLGVVLPCLLVSLLYMAGSAVWQDTTQFVVGAWLAVTGAAAAWAGLPSAYLIAAVGGGGGLLVGGLVVRRLESAGG